MSVEEDRLERMAEIEADRPDFEVVFGPGSFGCHEAMHMASVFADLVGHRLADHPAVVMRAAWYALACKAHEALFDLYQAIGADHMSDDPVALAAPPAAEEPAARVSERGDGRGASTGLPDAERGFVGRVYSADGPWTPTNPEDDGDGA